MASRTRRPTLIPRWLPYVAAALVAVMAVGVALLVFAFPVEQVSVPAVTSLDTPVARSRLAQSHLLLEVGDRRFSGRFPAGTVMEQDPPPGTIVDEWTVVTLVVSAGSESFLMPDVTGMDVEQARWELQRMGLQVDVETVASDEESGTVVSTLPSPGVRVDTDATVKLTIAGGIAADVLLPGDLAGLIVVLDPAPPAEPTADVGMEIARRLRSLLQASDAEVLISRSVLQTDTSAPARAAWAKETSASVVVGLSLSETDSAEGLLVRSVTADPENTAAYLVAVDLARACVTELERDGHLASLVIPADDPVLEDASVPGFRLFLGSPEDLEALERFADPAWADDIARALYRTLVSTFDTD